MFSLSLSLSKGCVTLWCPCITFGRNAEILDKKPSCKQILLKRIFGAIIYICMYACAYRFSFFNLSVWFLLHAACFTAARNCFMLAYVFGIGARIYTCTYRVKLRALYSLPPKPCGDCCPSLLLFLRSLSRVPRAQKPWIRPWRRCLISISIFYYYFFFKA